MPQNDELSNVEVRIAANPSLLHRAMSYESVLVATSRVVVRPEQFVPRDQSSFRIVPMPRFLVNSELTLLPNRSR